MNQSDRELLERAAKAAGYNVRWHEHWKSFIHVDPFNTDNPPTLAGQRMVWNPLTDDGDAFRLAVKLGLCINQEHPGLVIIKVPRLMFVSEEIVHGPGDYYAATRRAIVHAASILYPTP